LKFLEKSSNKFDDIFSKLPTLDSKEIKSQLILVKGLWKEFFKNTQVILGIGLTPKGIKNFWIF